MIDTAGKLMLLSLFSLQVKAGIADLIGSSKNEYLDDDVIIKL